MYPLRYRVTMTKQKAGERKRTVSVVTGPKTMEYLSAVAVAMEDASPGLWLTHTGIVGIALNMWMNSSEGRRWQTGTPPPISHYE